MLLKLPFSIRDEAWFPKPGTTTVWTEFEVRIDYLILSASNSVPDIQALAFRWNWPDHHVQKFLESTASEKFVDQDWFEEEKPSNRVRRERTEEVIALFNKVFDRKCRYNLKFEKLICKAIADGVKIKDPAGIPQFRAVFEYKQREWKGTKDELYLRIQTLCSDKFFQYLDEARLDYVKRQGLKKTEEEGITLDKKMFA